METTVRYKIFRTNWGYFGLAGTEAGLLRAHLPLGDPTMVKTFLLKDLPCPRDDETLFTELRQQIIAYFQGLPVDFKADLPLVLNGLSPFAKLVLTACRRVTFGQTISYGGLARKIGRPAAARAVGRVMANNPLPLIVPCHRVIRGDSKIGGFSAPGGVRVKKRMLELELQALAAR
jgi:methylated-DNA-[protein]-cysteine S-methyltransferase